MRENDDGSGGYGRVCISAMMVVDDSDATMETCREWRSVSG